MGVLQILSKLETVSCSWNTLLVIPDAIAGWTKPFLISPISTRLSQILQDGLQSKRFYKPSSCKNGSMSNRWEINQWTCLLWQNQSDFERNEALHHVWVRLLLLSYCGFLSLTSGENPSYPAEQLQDREVIIHRQDRRVPGRHQRVSAFDSGQGRRRIESFRTSGQRVMATS